MRDGTVLLFLILVVGRYIHLIILETSIVNVDACEACSDAGGAFI